MNNLQILIVEDNPAERELMVDAARGWGYKNVVGVRSAEGALRFLRGSKAQRFFISLDLGLPGMNGVNFSELVREEFPHKSIYIVIVSGRADSVLQAVQASVIGGIDAYLSKPVDLDLMKGQLTLLNAQIEIAKRKLVRDEQLVLQGTKDGLTGVWNRDAIRRKLEVEMNRARHMDDEVRLRRQNGESVLGSYLAVAILDVDNFKKFNDDHGHEAGDAVLSQFARRVDDSDRSSDELGRIGGDEFMIVAPSCAEKNLGALLKRIKRIVEETSFKLPSKEEVFVTATIGGGVSTFETREAGENTAALLKRADNAMYSAKAKGRNRVAII